MKKKLKLSEQCSLHGCIERLQSLVDGLKAGSFSVEHGDQTIVLRPGGHLGFDLRVEQNDKKEVLRLELGWHPQGPPRGKARKDGAHEHELALSEPAAAHPAAPSAASAAPYAQAEAEELELELEWELDEDVATQRRLTSDDSTAPPGARGPIEGPSGEPELVAPPFALPRQAAADGRSRLFKDA